MRTIFLLLSVIACVGVAAQPPTLDEVRRLLREMRLDEALAAVDARLAQDPKDRQARFLKGVVHAERQEDALAIETFTALTRDNPDLPEPYNNLAVLYASRGDYEAARDALLKAINTHPSYATAHENLGDIYAKMAGLAYTRALSLDTGNAGAKNKLALIDDLFTRGAPDTTAVAARRVPTPVAEPTSNATVAPAASTAAAKPAAVPAAAAASPPAVRTDAQATAQAAAEATAQATAQARVDQDAVIAALESWAAAWSAQDARDYLDHYVRGRSPEAGLSRNAWEAKRRDRLARPEFIEVTVDRFQVKQRGADSVDVTFVQAYRSNTYQDRVRKRVRLERTGDGWKISEERTLAKL